MSSTPGTGASTGRPGFMQTRVGSESMLEGGLPTIAGTLAHPRVLCLELWRMGRMPTAFLGETQQSAALVGSGKLSSRKGLVTILDFIFGDTHGTEAT